MFWEILFHDFCRFTQHDVTALACGDAAEDEHVIEIIEIRIMRNAVAEINAYGFVDFRCAFVTLEHEVLYFDKALWKSHVLRKFDLCRREEFVDGLLGKIQSANPEVA